jgi:CheY-like chemotaxis protein
VTEASNGEEGLRFLVRSPFDLVVSDVCMPGLGGYGLYAALRFAETPEFEACKHVPVMLLSGQVPARDMASALDAGVDDILEKPVDPEEFKARVRAALRRARERAAPRARTRGDLADFGLSSLAQALHLGNRNSRICVQSGAISAQLDFQNGSVTNASYDEPAGSWRGDDAAIRAFGLQQGVFQILPLPDSTPRTVFLDTQSLLLRAATRADETTSEARARRAEALNALRPSNAGAPHAVSASGPLPGDPIPEADPLDTAEIVRDPLPVPGAMFGEASELPALGTLPPRTGPVSGSQTGSLRARVVLEEELVAATRVPESNDAEPTAVVDLEAAAAAIARTLGLDPAGPADAPRSGR